MALFFSCRSKNQETVKNLTDKLRKETDYTIWVDIEQLGSGMKHYTAVQKAIRESTIFVAFITKDYIQSQNRLNELQYANGQNKKCIYVILESDIDPSPVWYDYILKGVFKYDAFKEPNWSGEIYNKFLEVLKANIHH